jgi:toxin FitB
LIILDTNVLSALMRDPAATVVLAWLDQQPRHSIWTTSVTIFEIRFGLSVMPLGRRRARLEQNLEDVIREDLEDRIAPFDAVAAEEAANLMAERRRRGSPGELRDSMIAGITIARRATLATRNTRHFADLAVPVVNPWTD